LKKIKLLLALLPCLYFTNLSAQQVPGLQYSNYGGLYRATYNPSILGGSRYKWQVNIGSLGGSINYRYFVFLGQNSLLYPLLTPHSTKELYGRSRTMGSLTQDPLYLVSEIRWPSAMFSIGKNQGIAIQFRSRGYVQGQNFPDPIKNMYFRRLDTGSTPEVSNQPWGNFNLVQQSFSEASISYGVALLNIDSHKLKVGGTLKRVFGARIGYLQGSADNFTIRSVGQETSELVVNNFNYETGYSQQVKHMQIGNLFNSSKYGAGWGYDLGASYELGSFWGRDKEAYDQSPEYLIRIAASVTDIGSIHYGTKNSKVITGSQATTVISQTALETISDKGPEGFMSLLPAEKDTSFNRNVQLPQALHLEADIQLVKGFFLNLSQTKHLKSSNVQPTDVFIPNSFTITPRFEDEDSDFAFPITFMNGNKKATIGAVGHFGPIFLGFSNVNGLIKKGSARGSMVYVGVTAWKLKERKRPRLFKSGKK
jgi:hypothetical protein